MFPRQNLSKTVHKTVCLLRNCRKITKNKTMGPYDSHYRKDILSFQTMTTTDPWQWIITVILWQAEGSDKYWSLIHAKTKYLRQFMAGMTDKRQRTNIHPWLREKPKCLRQSWQTETVDKYSPLVKGKNPVIQAIFAWRILFQIFTPGQVKVSQRVGTKMRIDPPL